MDVLNGPFFLVCELLSTSQRHYLQGLIFGPSCMLP